MLTLSVDPLVDRLMADGGAGAAHRQAAGDELRRPADAEAVLHVAADARLLEASVSAARARAGRSPRLGLVGQVVPGVHGGRVAPQLA